MVGLLVATVALAFLAIGLFVGERSTTRVLRIELNTARSNEQLLLTRLASRSPAEFQALTSDSYGKLRVVEEPNYLTDATGMIQIEDEADG